MTDAQLVAHAQEGVGQAFEELVKRHEGRVFSLARRLVGNAEDARDLAQEVFIRAYRALERVDPARGFDSWLSRITVNACRTFLAKRKPPVQLAQADLLADGATEQEQEVNHATAALREALLELAPKYRIALVLFHQEGKSCREIASMQDVTSNRVRTWLHRGRRLLREAMRRKGYGAL